MWENQKAGNHCFGKDLIFDINDISILSLVETLMTSFDFHIFKKKIVDLDLEGNLEVMWAAKNINIFDSVSKKKCFVLCLY